MALAYSVRFEGAALASRAEKAARDALMAAGEDVRRRANAIAPRRTGAMVASSRVESDGRRVRVSYGAAYARIQHDATGFYHPGGGQARYLAQALADGRTAAALREIFIGEL